MENLATDPAETFSFVRRSGIVFSDKTWIPEGTNGENKKLRDTRMNL